MGANCCQGDFGKVVKYELNFGDELTSVEKTFGLQELEMPKWAAVMKDLVEQKEISLEQLASSLPANNSFARQLTSDEPPRRDNNEPEIVRVLQHSSFKSRSGNGLDPKKIFCLGFLYCRGKYEHMVDAIFEVYDKNKDGSLFVNSFRKIVKQIVLIAICVVPTVHYKLNEEETVDKTYDDVENISQDIVTQIFGDQLQRDILNVLAGWRKKNVGDLLGSALKLRQKASVKFGNEDAASVQMSESERIQV